MKVQISFAVIFLVLGIVTAVQYKSTEKNKQFLEVQGKSIQEVQAELIRQKEYSESLLEQISDEKAKLEKFENSANVEELIKAELQRAKNLAGLTKVKGKGVIIKIDDTNADNGLKGIVPGTDNYIVSDANLLELLNDLRAAGAEAISINGERILATTEIRKAGSFIRINNKNYNRPFEIKVIGDPKVLMGSLSIREGIVEYLKANKIDVPITESDNVEIEEYKGALNFNYLNKN